MKVEKVYFLQRLVAFLVDVFLVSFICSIVTMPFTNSNNISKLSKESQEIVNDLSNKKIDVVTYFNKIQDVSYDLSQETCVASVIEIIIFILYFVVFQVYNGGQTIGKKLLKMKVVSNDSGDLNMNSMVLRAFLDNFILSNILSLIISLFGRSTYFYGSFVILILQYIVVFISIFMVLFGKEGRSLGDLVSKTKVVNCK